MGGNPIIDFPLRPYTTIGLKEKNAVIEVMEAGKLIKLFESLIKTIGYISCLNNKELINLSI